MPVVRLAPSVYAFWPSKFLSRCAPRTWSYKFATKLNGLEPGRGAREGCAAFTGGWCGGAWLSIPPSAPMSFGPTPVSECGVVGPYCPSTSPWCCQSMLVAGSWQQLNPTRCFGTRLESAGVRLCTSSRAPPSPPAGTDTPASGADLFTPNNPTGVIIFLIIVWVAIMFICGLFIVWWRLRKQRDSHQELQERGLELQEAQNGADVPVVIGAIVGQPGVTMGANV